MIQAKFPSKQARLAESTAWSRRHWLVVLASAGPGLVLTACRQPEAKPTASTTSSHSDATTSTTASPVTGVEVTRSAQPSTRQDAPTTLNLFVAIFPDNTIRLTVARTEMGQGTRTAMAAIVAHELDVEWEAVEVVQADGDTRYGSQNTDGSTSVREQFEPLRAMGASARAMLIKAAAKRWGVAGDSLTTERGKVIDRERQRELSYGELAQAAAGEAVPTTFELRPITPQSLIGTSPRGVDVKAMVQGQALFGFDHQQVDQRVAVIARPPTVGGTIASLDEQAARAIPGVEQILRIGPLAEWANIGESVVVVAKNTWAALKGREALVVTWRPGPRVAAAAMTEVLKDAMTRDGEVLRQEGSFHKVWAKSTPNDQLELTLTSGFIPHLPMEPPACTVHWQPDRCEVWVHSQSPADARHEIATLLGMKLDQVKVHVLLAGGAFGRKGQWDYIAEAVLAARAAKVPLKVLWSREDEVRHGYYRPATAQKVSVLLDAAKKPVAWRHRSAYGSIASTFDAKKIKPESFEGAMGQTNMPYRFAHVQIESVPVASPLRIGWVRAVHHVHHACAVNCMIDAIAQAQGRDPIDVHLELLGDGHQRVIAGKDKHRHEIDLDRMRRVVARVRELSAWRPHADLGFAVHFSFQSYVAAVVQVKVNQETASAPRLRVERAWVVVDCGQVVHRHHALGQAQGAVVFALSEAFYGEVAVEEGAVTTGNFDKIPVLRAPQVPTIDVEFIESKAAPSGLGEPVTPVVAPALLNAIAAASGKRVTNLPLHRQFSLT